MHYKNKIICRLILQICFCATFLFLFYFMVRGTAGNGTKEAVTAGDISSEETQEEESETPEKEDQTNNQTESILLEETQEEDPEILVEEESKGNQKEGSEVEGKEEAESGAETETVTEIETEPESEEKKILEMTKRSTETLRNWSNYNGIIFGNAAIYDATFGGGLAVSGNLSVYRDFTVGATYTSEYDATLHIGEYKNEERLPTLLLGGNQLQIDKRVRILDVYGGAVAMSPELLEYNHGLEYGFTARTDSEYQHIEQTELNHWFSYQYQRALNTSKNLNQGNDVTIELEELSSGSYLNYGAEYFENRFFEVNGEVQENILLITVRTGNDVAFGIWWPEFALISVDANWARAYDLVVFNFPDAVNVSMNASAFQYYNVSYWSTTVDAWIGEEGRAQRQALAGKVVYNFPSASSIEASHALIQGSILAPDATFNGIGRGSDGHIYGHIITKNLVLQDNFNLHAFPLTNQVYTLIDEGTIGKEKTGTIELRQYLYFRDKPSNIRLSGGEYILIDQQGRYYNGTGQFVDEMEDARVYITQSTGNAVMNQVPYGEYILRCIRLPESLSLNDADPENQQTYFEMPVSLSEEQSKVSAVHYSELHQSVFHFRKKDHETGAGIKDAVFAMVREADEYEDATIGNYYSSGEDGEFISHNLTIGNYRLVEVEIPGGYSLLEDGEFCFQVYWDETEEQLRIRDVEGAILGGTADNPVEIDNLSGIRSNILTVVKYAHSERESEAFYTLPGAEFDLYRLDDTDGWQKERENAIGEEISIVTGELGYIRVENMNSGIFRLVEKRAPDGYQLNNPLLDEANLDVFPAGYAYEFEIGENSQSETAYISNNAWNIDLTLLLQGNVLLETIPLAGVAFRLDHLLKEKNTWEEIFYRDYTDKEGKMVLKNLEEGSYRLTQMSSAAGYNPLEPATIIFTVDFREDGQALVEVTYNGNIAGEDSVPVSFNPQDGFLMTIQNTARTRGLTVYKIDADYQVKQNEIGQNHYNIQYLEEAQFRLRRRISESAVWKDYGTAFTSKLAYDDEGNPILDGSGNHVTQAIFEEGLLYGEYQLVEVKAPEGYLAAAEMEVVFEDGQEGRMIHAFTITENMTGTDARSEYVVSDYAIIHDTELTLRKVDQSNWKKAIKGARLALYTCVQDHSHDETAGVGACWNNQAPVIRSSDTEGMVTFEELESGSYLLVEVKAAEGYRLSKEQWLIVVDPQNDSFDIKQMDGSEPTLIVEDPAAGIYLLLNLKKLGLPLTGAGGRGIYVLLALILIGSAAAVYIIKSKKEKDKKDEENEKYKKI